MNWRRVFLPLAAVTTLALSGCSGSGDGDGDADGDTFEVTTTMVSHETTQDMWVWAPDADGSWPIVYALHGTDSTGDELATTASRLASHGYVVFSPTWRSEMDGECGYRYALTVADQYGGDPDLGIIGIGHSLGATAILVGGLNDAAYAPGGTYDACFTGGPRPSLVVPIAGCHYEYQGNSFGFDPVPFSGRDVDITLVVGDNDTECEPWQSQDATEALNDAGYNAQLVEVEGGDHANVVFHEIVDDEWVSVPDDPIGEEVVQIILDAIDTNMWPDRPEVSARDVPRSSPMSNRDTPLEADPICQRVKQVIAGFLAGWSGTTLSA